jgi:hypothetical protein
VRSLTVLKEGFYRELSDELGQIADEDDVASWINDGRTRLGYYEPKTAALTWSVGDYLVTLPVDCCEFDSVVPDDGVSIPPHRVWNNRLRFDCKATSAGTATLFYGATPAAITGDLDSTLPDVLDQALISYALFRFFKWLAASRSDYRRYSTIAQGNAADVNQLLAAASGHRTDFIDAISSREIPAPVSFYGEG